jgi:glutaredoxin-related protein
MTLLSLVKIAGTVVAIATAIYNLVMFLAIGSSEDTSGNMEEYAKRIGIPSLIAAAILIYLCH